MARPRIEKQEEVVIQEANTEIAVVVSAVAQLDLIVQALSERIAELENKVNKPKAKTTSINKVEDFNGVVESTPYEDTRLRLNTLDKIQSAKNAAKILPPNLLVDGRHSKENIGAICGFIVTDEMWDAIYEEGK